METIRPRLSRLALVVASAVCAAACATSPWPALGLTSSRTAATPTILLVGAGRVGTPYLRAGDPGGFLVYAESR